MSEEMQSEVLTLAQEAFDKFKKIKDMAILIKDYFDGKYGSYWMCILGSVFEHSVSHDKNCFISFQLGKIQIVLFKLSVK